MEFSIDFIKVGDGDAILIWGREIDNYDVVFFVDGGNTGNGQKVIDHYKKFIKPNLYQKRQLVFVNTHPHADHINGLLEILNTMGGEFDFGIYNDPVECITEELRELIYKKYLDGEDADISHLYKTFTQVEELNDLCAKHSIKRLKGYSDNGVFLKGAVKILAPSLEFYVSLVQEFTDVDFLKANDFSKKKGIVNQVMEDVEPCNIVDAATDPTPENLSSIVLELTSGSGKKILLTADAGVATFDYIEQGGHDLSGYIVMQLPHHGSRRNIDANWVKKFGTSKFIASAVGDGHHPRRALINCIKRNVQGALVYSTHKHGTINSFTNRTPFPVREGWSAISESL